MYVYFWLLDYQLVNGATFLAVDFFGVKAATKSGNNNTVYREILTELIKNIY